MSSLGMSILLEGEARGEAYGEEKGVDLSAKIFKLIQAGERDNVQIAIQCGCATEKVENIRKKFGI